VFNPPLNEDSIVIAHSDPDGKNIYLVGLSDYETISGTDGVRAYYEDATRARLLLPTGEEVFPFQDQELLAILTPNVEDQELLMKALTGDLLAPFVRDNMDLFGSHDQVNKEFEWRVPVLSQPNVLATKAILYRVREILQERQVGE
jgi:hypothetical protein